MPDENDDPSEINEFGRLADFISGSVPENEFRNFGAENRKRSAEFSSSIQRIDKPFSNCENVIERSLI